MRFLRAPALQIGLLAAALAACDTGNDPVPFDPSTVDYDAVSGTDFGDYVQPLLAARDVFATGASSHPGDLSDYTWSAIFGGPQGETIVPFDEEGSFLVRFAEDLPAEADIPYPNLRLLEPDELRFVKRWIAAGAPADDGSIPYADAELVLYACEQGGDQNSVALIDMERMRVIRRVYLDALGVPAGQYGPHHVVFEPDGSAWFVSVINGGADSIGRVLKLSTSLTTDPGTPAYLLAQSPAFRTPGMMAVNPATGSNQLFVGRSSLSQSGTPGVGVFNRTDLSLIDEVATPFDIPHALGITDDGQFVLTASLTGNTLATIRTDNLEVIVAPLAGPPHELIHFGVHPAHPAHHAAAGAADLSAHAGHEVGATADPTHLAEITLTSRSTDEVLFFRLNDDGSLTPNGTVAAGDGPFHAHLGADGTTLLVPNQFGGTVTLIDVLTQAVIRTVQNPAGGPLSRPHSPAPGMDGTTFFVTNSNTTGVWDPTYRFRAADGSTPENTAYGNVAAFNATDGALLKTIQLGAFPSGLEHPMHHEHGAMEREHGM